MNFNALNGGITMLHEGNVEKVIVYLNDGDTFTFTEISSVSEHTSERGALALEINYLADNEIRYVKFSYNDISRIMIVIVAQLLKISEYSSIMIQKDKDLYEIYISKHDFNYEVIKGGSSAIKFVDKTIRVGGRFL